MPRRYKPFPTVNSSKSWLTGNISDITIGPEAVRGTIKGTPSSEFVSVRVIDPDLVKQMDELNIIYSGRSENKFFGNLLSWILPLGFIYLIWRFTTKSMGAGAGGVMSF